MAHQAAQKALEAASLALTRGSPPLTHNLPLLAERTSSPVPVAGQTAPLRLARRYTASRYPDVTQGQPELQYNRALPEELLRASDNARMGRGLHGPAAAPGGEPP